MTSMGMRGFGALIVLVLATSACSTNRFETSANFDTEYDFAKVESFAFRAQRAKSAETSHGQIIQMTIREELISRGYREVAVDQADVYVAYDYGRYAPAKLSGSNSFAVTRGTLTVTVLDPRTMRTVWYGWVETNMRPSDDGEVVIAEAVDALFAEHLTRAKPVPGSKPDASTADPAKKKVSAAEKDVDEAMDDAMGDGSQGK